MYHHTLVFDYVDQLLADSGRMWFLNGGSAGGPTLGRIDIF